MSLLSLLSFLSFLSFLLSLRSFVLFVCFVVTWDSSMGAKNVFITGGTGYVGRALIPELLQRGHAVRALVRPGSENKVASGCERVLGDALDESTFTDSVRPSDTFVQLVGVPNPSPAKAEQFRAVDLRSIRASVAAASAAGIRHFIYVSVAHPAPVMRAYIEVRSEGERLIRETGLNATLLRPWYVLGPGHRWPYLLKPIYAAFELLPATRQTALRLGLVTIEQMVSTLAVAVEGIADGVRTVEVQEIRRSPKIA